MISPDRHTVAADAIGGDLDHLAAMSAAAHSELVLTTGDTDVAKAARSVGISVAFTY